MNTKKLGVVIKNQFKTYIQETNTVSSLVYLTAKKQTDSPIEQMYIGLYTHLYIYLFFPKQTCLHIMELVETSTIHYSFTQVFCGAMLVYRHLNCVINSL